MSIDLRCCPCIAQQSNHQHGNSPSIGARQIDVNQFEVLRMEFSWKGLLFTVYDWYQYSVNVLLGQGQEQGTSGQVQVQGTVQCVPVPVEQ